MIHILLCCSAGMSTSMLVKKMKLAAEEAGIDAEIWAIPQADLPEQKEKADVVLLGPQIRYALQDIQKEVGEGKPVEVIELIDYGTMNGKKVLENAIKKFNEK